MQRIGWTLLLLGGGVLVGYWAYFMVAAVMSEAPLLIRLGIVVALSLALVAVVVLFATVVRDRLRERKEEEGQF